jgi:hypothetical protein
MQPSILRKALMRFLLALIVLTSFVATPLVRAADPTPTPSPEASATPAKKHSKKPKATAAAATTPAPASNSAATPAASPAAKKHTAPQPQAAQAPGGGNGQVWVNSETHVYHKEGSKWYGRTKNGKYMSEAEATKAGNKAAKNEKQ